MNSVFWLGHPFHMVTVSPWPLMVSLSLFSEAVLGLNFMVTGSGITMFIFFTACLAFISMMWWRDVIRESTFQGFHTSEVQNGLRIGVVIFILSEVMFFFSFFLSFFYLSLSPDIWIGVSWPPTGLTPISWMSVPLLNTLILLSSGVSVTWAHHSILEKNKTQSLAGLLTTVVLGFIFMVFQAEEYYESSFSMSDSCFGSIFYLSTGFHGLHVMVGTIFLFVTLMRLKSKHLSPIHHFGFESAAWYWHFVDVVWLVLFLCVYWWGGS